MTVFGQCINLLNYNLRYNTESKVDCNFVISAGQCP